MNALLVAQDPWRETKPRNSVKAKKAGSYFIFQLQVLSLNKESSLQFKLSGMGICYKTKLNQILFIRLEEMLLLHNSKFT